MTAFAKCFRATFHVLSLPSEFGISFLPSLTRLRLLTKRIEVEIRNRITWIPRIMMFYYPNDMEVVNQKTL